MTTLLYFVVTIAVVGVLYGLLRRPIREYIRMRGARVITCPDNEQPAAVRVDAGHAAFTAAGGHEHLRLDSCSRWPEKAGCGQECLKQIETQPMDCLVRTQVGRWYADKSCAICGKALGVVDWASHKPALRAPDGAHAGVGRRQAGDDVRGDAHARGDLLGLPRGRDVPPPAPGPGPRQPVRQTGAPVGTGPSPASGDAAHSCHTPG